MPKPWKSDYKLVTFSFFFLFFPCQKCVLKQQKWRVPSLQTLVTDVLRWALIVVADARWYKTRLTDFQSPQYKMYRKSSLCSFVIQAIGKTTGASELLNQFFFASAFWWLSIPCGIEEIKDKVSVLRMQSYQISKILFF